MGVTGYETVLGEHLTLADSSSKDLREDGSSLNLAHEILKQDVAALKQGMAAGQNILSVGLIISKAAVIVVAESVGATIGVYAIAIGRKTIVVEAWITRRVSMKVHWNLGQELGRSGPHLGT